MNNAYVGIGITIIVDEDAGGLRIESVTADSPAYKAGLQVGDIILEAEARRPLSLARPARATLSGAKRERACI